MKQIFLIFLPLLVFISDGCSFEETPPRPECEFVDFIATIQLADAKTANEYIDIGREAAKKMAKHVWAAIGDEDK